MKRFHELTKEQQEQAVDFAASKLQETINHGVLVSDRNLTQRDVREIATAAAEDAWYSEREDYVVADIADGK